MNNKIIIGTLIGIALGGTGGYFSAKQTYDVGMSKTEMNDTMQKDVKMMTDEGESLNKMGEIMKISGTLMQDRGAKYQDNEMISQGKDMQAVGEKTQKKDRSMAE